MATAGLKGMNTDQATALAKSCLTDADTITTITSKLSGQINSTEWYGTDANSFRTAWESEYSKDLKTVAAALQSISTHLQQEVAQQEQASGN